MSDTKPKTNTPEPAAQVQPLVRRGFVCINSWAGREEKPCLIIGETRKRYRIKVEQPTALPPKWKILHPGETKLVPKWAVKIRRAVVSASCARIGCSKS